MFNQLVSRCIVLPNTNKIAIETALNTDGGQLVIKPNAIITVLKMKNFTHLLNEKNESKIQIIIDIIPK